MTIQTINSLPPATLFWAPILPALIFATFLANSALCVEEIESVDNFAYEPGAYLHGIAGGAGFSGPWAQNPETFFDPTQSGEHSFYKIVEGPLEYPGLEVPGNRVVFEGGGTAEAARFETLIRNFSFPFEEGTIVLSCLVRLEDISAVKYADVQLIGTNHNVRIHFDSSGQVFLEDEPTTAFLKARQTHLILARINLHGEDENDYLMLWVDPNLSKFGEPTLISNSRNYGTITGVRIEAQSTDKVEWDAIRVATATEN